MSAESFRVGQAVSIQTNHYGKFSYKTHTSQRETKLYWIVDGEKFRKADGYQPGEPTWIGHTKTLLSLDERNRRRAG